MFVVATNGQVALSTSVARIVPARPGSLLLRNVGADDCYLGVDDSVTTSTGFQLKAGEIFQPNSTGEIWGITASTTRVAWWSEADRFSPGTAD